MPKALITGITGQDGSYLSELLLEKGYQVHGIIRRVAIEDPDHHMSRIQHLTDDLHLHPASMESFPSIYSVVRTVQPDECYHLAAQSFVATSFQDAFTTLNTNINGTHYILAALHDLQPDCRYYFAGSSEMFGKVAEVPQSELTRFHPRSPYGISKVAGYDLSRNYREAYDMHASSGILFNHESPRRGFEFITRKITSHVARIKLGLTDHVSIGNLDSKRDWGHSREYVRAMWMMLQQDEADDYVVATGETHSIRELCELAFSHVDLNWEDYVRIDERFLRPAEVDLLVGDATKARDKLGWQNKITFEGLIREMVDSDLELFGRNPNA
ncbi:MAG TPA: GDP-mannose 4,6-dehydratase [Candidatus Latescibacteria bacterium]|nr:GDP-mannose 4,6-dehydratase [Candidatus Latescibacterota bacterium]